MKLTVCLFVCLFGISDSVLAKTMSASSCPNTSEVSYTNYDIPSGTYNWVVPEGWLLGTGIDNNPPCYLNVDGPYEECATRLFGKSKYYFAYYHKDDIGNTDSPMFLDGTNVTIDGKSAFYCTYTGYTKPNTSGPNGSAASGELTVFNIHKNN